MMKLRQGIPWFKDPEEIIEVCAAVGITPAKARISLLFQRRTHIKYVYCLKTGRISNRKELL